MKRTNKTLAVVVGSVFLIAFGVWLHHTFFHQFQQKTTPAGPQVPYGDCLLRTPGIPATLSPAKKENGVAFSDTINVVEQVIPDSNRPAEDSARR